ncbi:hypothetical protein FRACYDRAFT_242660 [Fragilariopsis cylindrus CCMP1102]|uniref:Uncharacterized protein n=1 Tax=Fragilariopsis cylindrus CCMP1102 TaxID=635003 RepID=A0A1E7F4Q1_9STRA|nr:hypothetical protein FRACYDRAFT_242660 [Fragilariopsis cylindrus CCMP1102]|eukprot:OEU13130.1 hypothetical protein FRACYDRAFT_242660 [Fragilariopsis cylindrus CCMP1102]
MYQREKQGLLYLNMLTQTAPDPNSIKHIIHSGQGLSMDFLLSGVDLKHPKPSSHQNGPVKRTNCSVGDHVRALLESAALGIKFVPTAFFYHLCNTNVLAPAK